MTSRQIVDSLDQALAEVDRRLASGELDGSGCYYTDEELAAGAATGRRRKQSPKSASSSAEQPAASSPLKRSAAR